MKALRQKKILAIDLADRSLRVAEVIGGERPQLRRAAEMEYPDGVGLAQPDELGRALGKFLADEDFGVRTAIIGLPARWVVVKPKDVPPADQATLINLLRVSVEAEFSSDLKELVYDFTRASGDARSVLLFATPGKNIEQIRAMCAAAKLTPVCVAVSALALAQASKESGEDDLILAATSSGAELIQTKDRSIGGLKSIRATAAPAFTSELRRAISTLAAPGGLRTLTLWGDDLDAEAMAEQLAIPVHRGAMATLGVDSTGSSNGHGKRADFAMAIALGRLAVSDEPPAVDFLHPRLAEVKAHRVPRWAVLTALALIAVIAGSIYAYTSLVQARNELSARQARLASEKPALDAAKVYVSKAAFAEAFRGGDARYTSCWLDLTRAVPEDGAVYARSLVMKEKDAQQNLTSTPTSQAPTASNQISGTLVGVAPDQGQVQNLIGRLQQMKQFVEVKFGGTQVSGKNNQVEFTISFTYQPAVVTGE